MKGKMGIYVKARLLSSLTKAPLCFLQPVLWDWEVKKDRGIAKFIIEKDHLDGVAITYPLAEKIHMARLYFLRYALKVRNLLLDNPSKAASIIERKLWGEERKLGEVLIKYERAEAEKGFKAFINSLRLSSKLTKLEARVNALRYILSMAEELKGISKPTRKALVENVLMENIY